MEPKTPRGPRVVEEAEDMEQDLNSSQHAPSSEVVPSSSISEPSQAQQGSPRDDKKDKVEREAEFIRLLVRNDFSVLHELYASTQSGSEASIIVNASVDFFHLKGPQSQLLLELLKSVIDREVDATASPQTLFRSNSAAAKMLSATLKLVGSQYLNITIKRVVADVCQSSPNLEIDPSRVNDDLEVNQKRLISYCQTFLTAILKSLDDCPMFIRRVCQYLQMTVVRKFPESKQIRQNLSAVGGLLFLRFFCPAIFAPHNFGLVPEAPSAVALRSLILISKVLQMMANGLQFRGETSEGYMTCTNQFIEQNSAELIHYFSLAASIPEPEEIERLEHRQKHKERLLMTSEISQGKADLRAEKGLAAGLDWKGNFTNINQMLQWKNNVISSPQTSLRKRAGTTFEMQQQQQVGPKERGARTRTFTEAKSPLAEGQLTLGASGTSPTAAEEKVLILRSDEIVLVPRGRGGAQQSRDDSFITNDYQTSHDPGSSVVHHDDKGRTLIPVGEAAEVRDNEKKKQSEPKDEKANEKEQEEKEKDDPLDIIHYSLNRNIDKIRVQMHNANLIDDLTHLERVLVTWPIPEIDPFSKRSKTSESGDNEKHVQKDKEQESRDKDLKENKEKKSKQATRRLLSKMMEAQKQRKDKIEKIDESNDEGEELARMVGKLRMDRESEEDMRRQAEWEKDNLRKAKEMIEKELKLLVIENKTLKAELTQFQKDKEDVDSLRRQLEQERQERERLVLENQRLSVLVETLSNEKNRQDLAKNSIESERDEISKSRQVLENTITKMAEGIKLLREEKEDLRDELLECQQKLKEIEIQRAKTIRMRLAREGSDYLSSTESDVTSCSSDYASVIADTSLNKGSFSVAKKPLGNDQEQIGKDQESEGSFSASGEEQEECTDEVDLTQKDSLQNTRQSDEVRVGKFSTPNLVLPGDLCKEDSQTDISTPRSARRKKKKDKKETKVREEKEKKKQNSLPLPEDEVTKSLRERTEKKEKRSSKGFADFFVLKRELDAENDKKKEKRYSKILGDKDTQSIKEEKQNVNNNDDGRKENEGDQLEADSGDGRDISKIGKLRSKKASIGRRRLKGGSYVASLTKPSRVRTPSHTASQHDDHRRPNTAEMKRSQSFDHQALRDAFPMRVDSEQLTDVEKLEFDIIELGHRMARGMEIKTHKHNLKRYENCFKGSRALDWLLAQRLVQTRQRAQEVGQFMLSSGLVFVCIQSSGAKDPDKAPFDEKAIYQLVFSPQ